MTENIVAETAERIFSDLADVQSVNGTVDAQWKAPLWRAVEDAGLSLCWVAEEHHGAGASLAEGFSVARSAGRFALAVPLVETMLAGWLLDQGGIASPAGMMTVAPARPRDRVAMAADGTLSGRARGIPFATDASHIAVIAQGAGGATIALVAASACRIEPGEGLGGDAADSISFDGVRPMAAAAAPAGVTPSTLMLMGATLRSLQIAGALETMLDITVRYANERIAFEKPIAKFQAVQHNLARLAGEVAASTTAAGSAADAIANGASFDDAGFFEAAAAKIRCGEAAATASAIAHQVHGAIGFSVEHVLHRYSLRALGWRDDFGPESHWAVELGRFVAARGADELWPLVASR
ncbi:MAG: acyl-CoA/acyl-ACP dehydrogenase [Afipia sp.]|nr:acyl-CoA/acyl-ACP dehydrogenase [Afipia sp.]